MGTTLLVILDHLRRMRGDSAAYSISMWVMEFLVLGLIAYEVLMGILERRASNKRKHIIGERVRTLRAAMLEGQRLQQSAVPSGDHRVAAWHQSVMQWTEKTRGLLAPYSPQAETSFDDISDIPHVNTYGSVGDPFVYAHLLARLRNLRGIIEKPDVYF